VRKKRKKRWRRSDGIATVPKCMHTNAKHPLLAVPRVAPGAEPSLSSCHGIAVIAVPLVAVGRVR
jgi:hypothetical protein